MRGSAEWKPRQSRSRKPPKRRMPRRMLAGRPANPHPAVLKTPSDLSAFNKMPGISLSSDCSTLDCFRPNSRSATPTIPTSGKRITSPIGSCACLSRSCSGLAPAAGRAQLSGRADRPRASTNQELRTERLRTDVSSIRRSCITLIRRTPRRHDPELHGAALRAGFFPGAGAF